MLNTVSDSGAVKETVEAFFTLHPVLGGLVGGIVIALLNSLGALLILVWRNPSEKFLDAGLGFSAGVMLTASFTSLILPGIERGGILPVLTGMVLGALIMDIADRLIPHEHFVTGKEGPASKIRGVWLFIIAITIHNFPEGLAVGVGFGSGDWKTAITLMLSIGFQNIPEGFSVALSSRAAGLGATFYAALVGIRSGLVEIPAAFLGAVAVGVMSRLIPYAMGFAAGAMLYVVSDEIIPETHRKGHERAATFGTIIGIIVMLTLDVLLG